MPPTASFHHLLVRQYRGAFRTPVQQSFAAIRDAALQHLEAGDLARRASRERMEVEAESVAFLVCAHAGIGLRPDATNERSNDPISLQAKPARLFPQGAWCVVDEILTDHDAIIITHYRWNPTRARPAL